MTGYKEISCRLCLKSITDKDFQVIDGVTKNILDVLLLKLKFRNENKEVVCSACRGSLNAALEFKSTCLNTDYTIIPHVDCETMLQLDLAEVYMKENGSEHLTGISYNHKICRLCMQPIKGEIRRIGEEEREAIHKLVPQMNIMIIKDPTICKPCFDSLCTHNTFLKNCLDVDQRIGDIFENSATSSQTNTSSSDSLVKYKSLDKETEFSEMEAIKTECVDITSEDEGSDMVLPRSNNETFENSDCKDSEEEEFKYMRKHVNRSSSFTESQTEALQSNSLIKNEDADKDSEINEVEMAIKTECIDIKSEDEESDTSSLILIDEPFDGTGEWLRECLTTSNTDCMAVQIYKCDFCEYETRRKSYLIRHELTHKNVPGGQMCKCSFCGYKTDYKRNLKQHLLRHKNVPEEQMFKCNSCEYKTGHKKYFTRHQLKHKGIPEKQKYKCDECNFKTIYKTYLKRHQLIHKDIPEEQMYKCDECNFKTYYKESFKQHQLRHKDISEEQMYKCDWCKYKTRGKEYFTRHQRIHKNIPEGQYKCDKCNFKTIYKKNFTQHQLRHKDIPEEEMYKCDQCDYKTGRKEYFARHQHMHKNIPEGRYKCDECNFRTIYKESFTQHQLRHKDIPEEQTYKCDECNFKTVNKKSLVEHQIRHKDIPEEQMHKCDYCEYKTRYKKYMITHLRKHIHIPKRRGNYSYSKVQKFYVIKKS